MANDICENSWCNVWKWLCAGWLLNGNDLNVIKKNNSKWYGMINDVDECEDNI